MSRAVRKIDWGRVDLCFTSRHVKKRILQVRWAERLALRPPVLGSARPCLAREGPRDEWRRNTKVTAVAPGCIRAARSIQSVPCRVAMVCTWLDRTFDIVWPMRRAPIVPRTVRIVWPSVSRLSQIIIIFARRQTKDSAEMRRVRPITTPMYCTRVHVNPTAILDAWSQVIESFRILIADTWDKTLFASYLKALVLMWLTRKCNLWNFSIESRNNDVSSSLSLSLIRELIFLLKLRY